MDVDKRENHIDELIGKYISGEASGDEVRFVETWIAASPENGRYFDQMKFIFNKAASVTAMPQFNADEAWNKVKAKLATSNLPRQGKSVQFEASGSSMNLYVKIAAAVIVAVGLAYFSYQFFKADLKPVEVVAEDKTTSDTLPDGSGVFLNKETKIVYAFNKKENTHVVNLKGEAYFSIEHNDDKKFIVKTDDVYIRDIGTSFNVKAYPESNTIEVVVEEGEVMFYSDSDSGVYLKAHGKGVYDKVTKKFTIAEPEPNAVAYKTKFFIFSDTDLGTVVRTLNEVYSTQITVPDHLKNCRLTATFNNENTEEITNVIAETLGLRVKQSGTIFSLEGTGCEQ
jgi:transmembrane sensor